MNTNTKNQTHVRRLARRSGALMALASASALLMAGPAVAKDSQPVNQDGKKACAIDSYGPTGQKTTTWTDHGTNVTTSDGNRWTCNDGVWEKPLRPGTGPSRFGGASGSSYTYDRKTRRPVLRRPGGASAAAR